MYNPLHSILDQELFKKHLCNSCMPKERNGAVCPSYINYHLVSITLCCQLCSTRYTKVQTENCSKSTSTIKTTATMKNTDDFCYEGKPLRAITKSTLFAVNKDEWDTKEDTGKSMKSALYILHYTKRHLSAEATSNSEKIKPVSLAIIALHLSGGISQSGSQLVENSIR